MRLETPAECRRWARIWRDEVTRTVRMRALYEYTGAGLVFVGTYLY